MSLDATYHKGSLKRVLGVRMFTLTIDGDNPPGDMVLVITAPAAPDRMDDDELDRAFVISIEEMRSVAAFFDRAAHAREGMHVAAHQIAVRGT